MSQATSEDYDRYAHLINELRARRGLPALTSVMDVADPRPYIREMEALLTEGAT